MVVMWLTGMGTSATGCSNVSYLRGSQELPDTIARMLETARANDTASTVAVRDAAATSRAAASEAPATPASDSPVLTSAPTGAPASKDSSNEAQFSHPLVRASLVREQARLDALAAVQQRAFPFSLAQTMLGALLVAAATGVLSKRAGAREFALQTIFANAMLAALSFGALSSVRVAMADAVAAEIVAHPLPGSEAPATDATLRTRRAELLSTDRQVLVLHLGVFGLAAFALSRPRSKILFRKASFPPTDGDDSEFEGP